jgi:hypothetical protein
MTVPTVTLRVDWDKDGTFTAGIDDVSTRVLSDTVSWTRGRSADFSAEATGSLSFTLRNDDDRYTPDRNWHDNPSFETGTTGWSVIAIASLTAAATSISQVTDNATSASGTKAGEAVLTATSNSGVTFPIPYTFRSGVSYAVSVYLKSASGALAVRAGLASAGTPADIASSSSDITTSWAAYTFTWTPSADRSDAVFFVRTTAASAATVRIDAVQVNPGTAANTYLEAPTRGQLVPGRPVHLYATYSATDYPEFYGWIERLRPVPATRTVEVTCYDPLAAMGRASVVLDTRSRTHREIRIDALNAWANATRRRNYASNPVFATDTTGWTAIGAGATLTRVTTDNPPEAGTGTTCADLAVTTSGSAQTNVGYPVPAGATIRFTLWAKVTSGTPTLTLTSAVSSDTVEKTWTPTSSWARYTVVGDFPSASTFSQHLVEVTGTATVRFGAVKITYGPEDTAYVDAGIDYAAVDGNWLGDPSFEIKPITANWDHARFNHCSNPSFETDTTGWSNTADAFHGAGGALSRISTAPYSGTYHLSQTSTLTSGEGLHYTMPGTFYSGITYVATIAMRTASGSFASAAAIGIGSQGTPADYTQTTISGNTTYAITTLTWTPSADRSDVHLYFKWLSGASYTVYFDAVLVTVDYAGKTETYADSFGLGSETSSFTRVTTGASSGTAAMQVVTYAVDGSGVRYKTLWDNSTQYAGQPVTAVARLKSVSGSTSLKIKVGNEESSTDSASASHTITTSWADYAVSWTPTVDSTKTVVVLCAGAASAATFLVDCVRLYLGTSTLTFDPSFATLDSEDGRAPDYAGSGTPASLLTAVNGVTLTRHWIEPAMTSPWWSYVTQSRATLLAAASAETYSDDLNDARDLEIADTVINVQKVTPGTKYIDANGATQTNADTNAVYASDAASVTAHGPHLGTDISSALIENKLDDPSVQQALADAVVAAGKQPRPRPTITVVNRFPSQLVRELGDVVTITFARAAIYAQRYTIARIDTRISDQGNWWQTDYALEEMP